jgi:PAS domain S-box-containing protein
MPDFSDHRRQSLEDITGQGDAQRTPSESEERFRMLVELAPEAIVLLDPENNLLVEANRKAEEIFGCTRDELLSVALPQFYATDQPDKVAVSESLPEHTQRVLAGEEVIFERAIISAKGEQRCCEVRLAAFPSSERQLILGSFIDISQRKRTEELLKCQVKFNDLVTRLLTHFSSCVATEVDVCVTEALQQLADFVGVDHAHVIMIAADRSTWSITHEWCGPGVQPQYSTYQNIPLGSEPWSESKILSGESVRINTLNDYPTDAPERHEPDKKAGATSTLLVPIHGSAGLITGAVGMDSHSGDIVWSDDDVARCGMVGNAIAGVLERKNAEELLRKSEEKFSKVFEADPTITCILRLQDRKYLAVNQAYERRTGYSREEVIGRTGVDLGLWINLEDREQAFHRIVAERSVRGLEGHFRTKTKEPIIALLSGEIIEFEAEECVLVVAEDITERKRAEQTLRESERRFRVMSDSAPVMMWMSNPEKACTDFNRGWLEFTGRTLWQELGDGWTEGVHSADLEGCCRTFVTAFDERRQFTMEYRMRRHDGVYRWVMDTGVPRFLPDGTFTGYIGCCIDINDQREAEKAHLELPGRLMAAQEAERTRIARELHDGIGQSIALLGMQMQGADQPVSGASDRRNPSVQELCEKLMEIGNQVSRLSHQLHPWKLEFLGLAVTVKSLCRQFSEEYHIAVNCLCIDVPTNLENDVSLCFLRVTQEALHNIAKHSHATRVQVLLVGTARRLTLIVHDNGAGFEANTVSNVHPRVGLGLISMRERLHLIGGDFAIASEPGQGTRIEVHAPLLAMAH